MPATGYPLQENIRRLEIAVDYAMTVSMMNGISQSRHQGGAITKANALGSLA
jgi:hypothetical protein